MTLEFYYAFLSWGFNLYDLKVLASNSILYSSIPLETKVIGLEKFMNEWNTYVNKTYDQVCATEYEQKIEISNVLPTFGPVSDSTKLTLFGSGFEAGICKNVYCIFGNEASRAVLKHIDEIQCITPLGFSANETVQISVQIGELVFKTAYNFTFMSSKLTIEDPDFYPKQNYNMQNYNDNGLKTLMNFYNIFRSFFKKQ